jgi:hypothetical protein
VCWRYRRSVLVSIVMALGGRKVNDIRCVLAISKECVGLVMALGGRRVNDIRRTGGMIGDVRRGDVHGNVHICGVFRVDDNVRKGVGGVLIACVDDVRGVDKVDSSDSLLLLLLLVVDEVVMMFVGGMMFVGKVVMMFVGGMMFIRGMVVTVFVSMMFVVLGKLFVVIRFRCCCCCCC